MTRKLKAPSPSHTVKVHKIWCPLNPHFLLGLEPSTQEERQQELVNPVCQCRSQQPYAKRCRQLLKAARQAATARNGRRPGRRRDFRPQPIPERTEWAIEAGPPTLEARATAALLGHFGEQWREDTELWNLWLDVLEELQGAVHDTLERAAAVIAKHVTALRGKAAEARREGLTVSAGYLDADAELLKAAAVAIRKLKG